MSAARFRPPDNLGGWAPLGLSVSGRTILTTISKRIEVPHGANARRSLEVLRSVPLAAIATRFLYGLNR